MFCPNCGRTNSEDQRFCRSCGLSLEKTLQSLSEQLPGEALNEGVRSRQRLVERLLQVVGFGAISLVVGAVLWGIIYRVMLVKGEIIGGSVFLAFVLGSILFGLLAMYRTSLARTTAKRQLLRNQSALTEPITGKLAPGEAMPSITETTTELLENKKTISD
jgi:uncharacterized membrane protein YedE/YeeE